MKTTRYTITYRKRNHRGKLWCGYYYNTLAKARKYFEWMKTHDDVYALHLISVTISEEEQFEEYRRELPAMPLENVI